MNLIQAITNKNLKEAFDSVIFENKKELMGLEGTDVNPNSSPHFKSIMEGLRDLDKVPDAAVIKLFIMFPLGYVHILECESCLEF